MREKYTFNFGREKHVFSKGYYETREHVILKLVAYIYFDRIPKIESKTEKRYKYKPDLVVDNEGRTSLWVECGKVSIKKLKRLRHDFKNSRIHVFRHDRHSAESLIAQLTKKSKNMSGINLISFEKDFIAEIARRIRKVNEISYKKYEKHLYICINGEDISSDIFLFSS